MTDFERTIGFGDVYGTRAEVNVYDPEPGDEGAPTISVAMLAGMSGGRGVLSLEAARQLAATLLDAVDHVERTVAE